MSDLYVDSVTKSFGIRQILTDIFITCKKGEIVGLLGRNGAGKSTLLKIIFGSMAADYKYIRIGNQQINGLYDNRALINYLPQNGFMPTHLKVSSIIALFCDKTNADLIIANEHIRPLIDKRTKQLSGGEKRLIEILLIVHSNAKYILIDEPFNGIAPIYKEEIKNLIKEQSKIKGFIITDHDYRNIIDIASRIILIHDGGTKEIKTQNELQYWGYIPEVVCRP
ncbi:MAG: ATP-binding cassette domain-containing protein [Bacteroidia bacterium]|nr:ATP-binding cassette domain-containing protein [Bacteroidia bacterium]